MDTKFVIISELERVYAVLNEKLFDGKLIPVKFSIAPKKKNSLRFFSESNTIVMGSDFPNLEYADVSVVLLHEMIHVRNFQAEILDCTTNQYHNKQFLNNALQVGLVAIKHKTQGWAITTIFYPRNVVEREYISKPSKEATAKRVDAFNCVKLDKVIFKQGRVEVRQRVKEEKSNKTYFLKYICNCPPPHNSIRSGRRPDGPNVLNIQCMNCHSKFMCVTELEPD